MSNFSQDILKLEVEGLKKGQEAHKFGNTIARRSCSSRIYPR